MRNLKRALSLALATVMTLGLMVVGTGAVGYEDVTSEDNVEAIEVLQAVGIMTGDENGNFNPDNTVTRNEMAVIMSQLLNLDYNYYRGTNPFTDVPAWAAPYVAACAAEGVTSGVGGGLYNGDGEVTAAQAALMILKALGYFQYEADFDGDWQVATIRQASYIRLFDGIDASAEEALTRNQIAQLVLNGLKSDMVYFTGNVGITVNGVVIGHDSQYTSRTGSSAKYNSLVGGRTDIAQQGQYYIQLGEELYDGDLEMYADIDAFGRPATTWTYDKEDIGTYMNEDMLISEYTVKVEGGDVYTDIGSEAADYDLTYWVDGEELEEADALEQAGQIARRNTEQMGNSGNGALTQIFVDKDAEELIITEINTYLAKTDEYNEKKETLRFDSIYGYGYGKYDEGDVEDVKVEDFPFIAEYGDGELVLLTIAAGEVQSIVEPERVADVEIDEFSKHDYVQADGTDYSYAATGALTDSYNYSILSDYDENNLDEVTFDLYLDTYGYLIGIKENGESTQYVFIAAYDRPESHLTNKTAEAKAIFEDGTEAVIEVNVSKSEFKPDKGDANDWDVENGDSTENTWYSYTEKNGVYTLEYVSNQFQDTKVKEIDGKHISQYDGKNYYYGNADTNYIVVDVDSVDKVAVVGDVQSVVTGVKNASIEVWNDAKVISEAKTDKADSQGVYTLHKDKGAYIIASVVIGDDGTVTDEYAYLYGEPERERYNRSEDCYYWDMNGVIEGKEVVITFQTDLPAKDSFAEGLYKLSYNQDGYAVEAVAAVHYDKDEDTGDYYWIDEFDPDDTTLIKTSFGTKNQPAADLTANGETLWITQQSVKRGFALADDCAAVIIEQVYDAKEKAWVADEIVEYSSVEKAIKALDNYDKDTAWNFDGDIIITFEDGLATSVLLTDTVDEDQPKNPGADEDGIRLNSLGIDKNYVTVNVTNLSSTDVITATGSTVEIKITSENGTQLFYADGVALNAATNGTGGLAKSETKDLSFAYAGSQAASGDYTVTVTIENENDSWSATAVLHLA